jgi:hypothetical protein
MSISLSFDVLHHTQSQEFTMHIFLTRIRIAALLVLAAMLCSAVTMLAQAPAASKPSPWLQAAKIDAGVSKIDDNAQDNMYLVEGKDMPCSLIPVWGSPG